MVKLLSNEDKLKEIKILEAMIEAELTRIKEAKTMNISQELIKLKNYQNKVKEIIE